MSDNRFPSELKTKKIASLCPASFHTGLCRDINYLPCESICFFLLDTTVSSMSDTSDIPYTRRRNKYLLLYHRSITRSTAGWYLCIYCLCGPSPRTLDKKTSTHIMCLYSIIAVYRRRKLAAAAAAAAAVAEVTALYHTYLLLLLRSLLLLLLPLCYYCLHYATRPTAAAAAVYLF